MNDARPPLRVLVVDAESVYRRCFVEALGEHPLVQVVATATNARTALPKAESYHPDVVCVDCANAEVDGLALLGELLQRRCGSRLLALLPADGDGPPMPSGCEALRRAPPAGGEAAVAALARDLLPRLVGRTPAVVAPRQRRESPAAAAPAAAAVPAAPVPGPAAPGAVVAPCAPPAAPAPAVAAVAKRPPPRRAFEIVGIGISTGGPKALAAMLPQLPADFPLPVVVVQHMPAAFTGPLAESLARNCALPVREARAGEILQPGHVLIAPGGRHTRVVRTAEGCAVRLTDDPPEQSCRPSVDYLFRSLQQVYGAATLAVVMTGMGEDGLAGCRLLRAAGAMVLAQDEASSTVYGMPRAVAQAGLCDAVLPLEQLAARICECARGAARCG